MTVIELMAELSCYPEGARVIVENWGTSEPNNITVEYAEEASNGEWFVWIS